MDLLLDRFKLLHKKQIVNNLRNLLLTYIVYVLQAIACKKTQAVLGDQNIYNSRLKYSFDRVLYTQLKFTEIIFEL